MTLKVEGTQRAKTHPSRTDVWNEPFELQVDKANEVEITIYDKQVSEPYPVPIGMLWIRINDLVEAQRRQKVEQEAGQGGWVTADEAGAMGGGASPEIHPGGHNNGSSGDFNNSLSMPGSMPGGFYPSQPEGIDAWFSVEPAGAVALRLNFGKSLPAVITAYSRWSKLRRMSANVLLTRVDWADRALFVSVKARYTK